MVTAMGGPAAEALRWAESVTGQPVVAERGLREGGAPWLLRCADDTAVVLRRTDGPDTEVAALRVVAANGIPAPRVIAVGDGLVLVSVVAGSSRIPPRPTVARLTALGLAAARLHAIALPPSAELPVRHRPIELEDFARWRERDGASALLREAEDAVARRPEPAAETVLVHGDLWQGNTMWRGAELTGILDWDCAGVGHPGVDLGELRCEVTITYGGDAPDVVLAGWRQRHAMAPEVLAYWDVVAALSTPPDLAAWESTIRDQGRTDLDPVIMTADRDRFLRAALDELDKAR